MAFFQFGRRVDSAKEYSLEEIPVFSTLTPAEQKIVEKKARLVEYKRGDIVYEEGEPAEAFYVVITGRFRLYSKSSTPANEETLAVFHRSDHFGETSLLTNRPHSGSVAAKKDGIILKLDRDDFMKLVKEIPAISLHLSRSLGHRLTSTIHPGARREVRVCSFFSPQHSEDVFHLWLDYASKLKAETQLPVVLVDLVSQPSVIIEAEFKKSSIPRFDFSRMDPSKENELNALLVEHPQGVRYLHAPIDNEVIEEKIEKKISTLITFLTYRYNYLLFRLPTDISHSAFQVLKQSDYVYVYCDDDPKRVNTCAEAVAEFQQSFGFSTSEIRILTGEDSGGRSAISYEEKEKLLAHGIFSVIPSKHTKEEQYQKSLRFLSKELAGTLVGLVLGSGAAYGLAHIGVLKVLEEEGIEVDVVSGSSMGAFIGALWAGGYNPSQLEKIAKQVSNKRTAFMKLIGFSDLSVAHRGFFKGNQVMRFMRSLIDHKTFQDLKIPLKIVAVDLFTSEPVVFESGSVVDAVRASISIPGIFRPYRYKDRTWIDGGVVDPLPVKALTKMGVKKIIAVNVLSGPKDRVESNQIRQEKRRRSLEKDKKKKGLLGRFMAQSADKMQDRYAENVFNVIMSTVQFMEFEIAESWSDQADVLIHPTVAEGHWAEFYSPEKFIKSGEEKTREKIEDIKRLISE